MEKDPTFPAPRLPEHLAHLGQEPELADAWEYEVGIRQAEAKKLQRLLDYKARKLAEHRGQHVFTRRAVEKSIIRDAAIVLGATEPAVRRMLDCAGFLGKKLPLTWKAYATGGIDLGRAKRVAQAAEDIAHRDDILPVLDTEAAVQLPAMNHAEVDQWVKQRVPELDAEAYSARCQRAKARRYVIFAHQDDGMTKIDALLPTVSVAPLERELWAAARNCGTSAGTGGSWAGVASGPRSEMSGPGSDSAGGSAESGPAEVSRAGNTSAGRGRTADADDRSLTQRAADAFTARLQSPPGAAEDPESAASPEGHRLRVNAKISILVPVETLTGQGEAPAISEDSSFLLPAAETRRIANDPHADHDWYAAGTSTDDQGRTQISAVMPLGKQHPLDGRAGAPRLKTAANLLATSSESRFATGGFRESLLLRDRTCRADGCVRPAYSADVDHRRPYAEGGRTNAENTWLLCRDHHMMKSHGLLPVPGQGRPAEARASPGEALGQQVSDGLSDQTAWPP